MDEKRKKCITKFISSPTSENCQLLEDLVRKCGEPEDSWPYYAVELLGRAQFYEEAMIKLKQLQIEENVLTLSESESTSDAQVKLQGLIRKRTLQIQSNKLDDLLLKKSTQGSVKKIKLELETTHSGITTIYIFISNHVNSQPTLRLIIIFLQKESCDSLNEGTSNISTYADITSCTSSENCAIADLSLPVIDVLNTQTILGELNYYIFSK